MLGCSVKRGAEFWIPRRKEPQRLPEVLSQDELIRLFAAATYPKHRALLRTAYAAGLRGGEVVRLEVGDIDSTRMVIRVQQGKGQKDRYTLLTKTLLLELREYWGIGAACSLAALPLFGPHAARHG